MAEARATNPLVAQFKRGGVARDLRLMAAQGLLPLKPEDLLELWTDLVSDADETVRGAAGESLKAFPAAELLPIIKNRETPASVLSWAVSNRAEPELREAALQNHSLPDATIEQLAPTLPPVLADSIQIQQVLLNLVRNAVESVDGGDGPRREVDLTVRRAADGGVHFTVRDTGPGLAPAALDKVFEPFYTTKPDGIGIGLPLSRSIADAHGGRVWASAEAEGAAFHLVLPNAQELEHAAA